MSELSEHILTELRLQIQVEKQATHARFFKSGQGQYGEGDCFLGVTVPDQRIIADCFYQTANLIDLHDMLSSEFHELRSVALQILVKRFAKSKNDSERAEIIGFFENHFDRVNNWDLVDLSAPKLTGTWYLKQDRARLFDWAKSPHLWTRRIAIMTSFAFIRALDFSTTLELADILLLDSHDLMQKATGWMLREVGNRDGEAERTWLAGFPKEVAISGARTDQARYRQMGRTMLRYAIEKFPKDEYQDWLKGLV